MAGLSVIAGQASEDLAAKIARRLGANLVKTDVRVFSDGESKITLSGKISRKKALVVQSTYPPVDSNLVHALSLVSKAREESAEVTAVVPYMGYARQDKEFLPGELVTMKALGRMFRGAGASRVITVDIHSKVGLRHFARATNVTAIPSLAAFFARMRLADPLVVSPDQGGKNRAKEFAKESGLEYIALEKERDRRTGRIRIRTESAEIARGRNIILVDDMISTGGSIVKAAQFLRRQKCKGIHVACTHALLIGDAVKKIRSAGVTKIVSTNTIPGRTAQVDVSKAIAERA